MGKKDVMIAGGILAIIFGVIIYIQICCIEILMDISVSLEVCEEQKDEIQEDNELVSMDNTKEELEINEEDTYNYKIDTDDYGTIYVHGNISKVDGDIDEKTAVERTQQQLIEDGFFDVEAVKEGKIKYHLNYISLFSHEESMWSVVAHYGTIRYQCLVMVTTGEVIDFGQLHNQ